MPLTDPDLQLEFVRQLKASGRWVACGTYPCGAKEKTETVRAAFEAADAFFCNEEEAGMWIYEGKGRCWAIEGGADAVDDGCAGG